jgi:hypothetical protein
VDGKAHWLAHGLPREGEKAAEPYAGDLADPNPPTCGPSDRPTAIRAALEDSRYAYCVVAGPGRVVLGRVHRGDLSIADDATAESLMEPGPGTVRFNTAIDKLVERLVKQDLESTIVTTPAGRLVGVFHREDGERFLRGRGEHARGD